MTLVMDVCAGSGVTRPGSMVNDGIAEIARPKNVGYMVACWKWCPAIMGVESGGALLSSESVVDAGIVCIVHHRIRHNGVAFSSAWLVSLSGGQVNPVGHTANRILVPKGVASKT